jgi:hypothetical protein
LIFLGSCGAIRDGFRAWRDYNTAAPRGSQLLWRTDDQAE